MFGCIYAPDFPVQAALHGDPTLFRSSAVAVLDGPESLLKVIACNDLARSAGVGIGMTKIQAESCGEVMLKKRESALEDSVQAALLDCGRNFSPLLESTAPGIVIVDLNGTERLLGPAPEIGKQMAEYCRTSGFEVNICVAANPDTAWCAARGFTGITIIAPGEEAARLARLPISVLQPPEEILEPLNGWGISNFAALAALPPIALTERLGQPGLYLQRVARGEVRRGLIPVEVATVFTESAELEEPLELLEPLCFILNQLLEEVMKRLKARSLATDHIQLDLILEVHSDCEISAQRSCLRVAENKRTLKLPVPTQDRKVLLKLMQLDLAAHPPQSPVRSVRVQAFPARIRAAQGGLFQPLAPEAAQLEITLARLRAVAGETDSKGRCRVGFPAVADSYRPDNFQVMPSGGKPGDSSEPAAQLPLALRRFRPVIPARVEVGADDSPVWIGFSRKKARVVHVSGRWRASGEWWDTADQWLRDEWDLQLTMDGTPALYRIFHDLVSRRWFVEGMYD